eukprot:Nk52_evm12s305 gene=Nk52_evmTU12s305
MNFKNIFIVFFLAACCTSVAYSIPTNKKAHASPVLVSAKPDNAVDTTAESAEDNDEGNDAPAPVHKVKPNYSRILTDFAVAFLPTDVTATGEAVISLFGYNPSDPQPTTTHKVLQYTFSAMTVIGFILGIAVAIMSCVNGNRKA